MRVELVCIPSSDATFAAEAHQALAAVPAVLHGVAAADDLQRRLQAHYPGALVRPREALAEVSTERQIVWYVTNRAYRSRIAACVEVPATVYVAFHTYVERVTEWQTAVRLRPTRITPGVIGSEWAAHWEFLGRAIDGVMRVVEADPPNSVRLEASGMGITVWYATSFTPAPGGTTVRVVGDYDLPEGILPRIADRLFIERSIQRQIEGAHKALVELCRADIEHSKAC